MKVNDLDHRWNVKYDVSRYELNSVKIELQQSQAKVEELTRFKQNWLKSSAPNDEEDIGTNFIFGGPGVKDDEVGDTGAIMIAPGIGEGDTDDDADAGVDTDTDEDYFDKQKSRSARLIQSFQRNKPAILDALRERNSRGQIRMHRRSMLEKAEKGYPLTEIGTQSC